MQQIVKRNFRYRGPVESFKENQLNKELNLALDYIEENIRINKRLLEEIKEMQDSEEKEILNLKISELESSIRREFFGK